SGVFTGSSNSSSSSSSFGNHTTRLQQKSAAVSARLSRALATAFTEHEASDGLVIPPRPPAVIGGTSSPTFAADDDNGSGKQAGAADYVVGVGSSRRSASSSLSTAKPGASVPVPVPQLLGPSTIGESDSEPVSLVQPQLPRRRALATNSKTEWEQAAVVQHPSPGALPVDEGQQAENKTAKVVSNSKNAITLPFPRMNPPNRNPVLDEETGSGSTSGKQHHTKLVRTIRGTTTSSYAASPEDIDFVRPVSSAEDDDGEKCSIPALSSSQGSSNPGPSPLFSRGLTTRAYANRSAAFNNATGGGSGSATAQEIEQTVVPAQGVEQESLLPPGPGRQLPVSRTYSGSLPAGEGGVPTFVFLSKESGASSSGPQSAPMSSDAGTEPALAAATARPSANVGSGSTTGGGQFVLAATARSPLRRSSAGQREQRAEGEAMFPPEDYSQEPRRSSSPRVVQIVSGGSSSSDETQNISTGTASKTIAKPGHLPTIPFPETKQSSKTVLKATSKTTVIGKGIRSLASAIKDQDPTSGGPHRRGGAESTPHPSGSKVVAPSSKTSTLSGSPPANYVSSLIVHKL
ncbi:unnamed protein product, partial [Amoebophrya sp. A120]